MTRRRYRVAYAHYDGNVYETSDHASLSEAQDAYARLRIRPDIKSRRLPCLVLDSDNPERGNLCDVDIEEGIDGHHCEGNRGRLDL